MFHNANIKFHLLGYQNYRIEFFFFLSFIRIFKGLLLKFFYESSYETLLLEFLHSIIRIFKLYLPNIYKFMIRILFNKNSDQS